MPRLVNRHPGRGAGWLLGVVPFIALLCIYLVGSHIRTAENPDDKLLPTPSTIASTMHSYAFEEDVRSGEVLFWVDTVASLSESSSPSGCLRQSDSSWVSRSVPYRL